MPYRGRPRGEPSGTLPPVAFVAFIQNHDRIGNRAFGERLSKVASPAALRAIAAVYLLLPQIPMLFMGEEWAASRPFLFFCDFAGELGATVRAGRRREYAQIPDPQAAGTFEATKLAWDEVNEPEHSTWLQFYRHLIAVRHASIIPLLPLIAGSSSSAVLSANGVVQVQWRVKDRGVLRVLVNLSDQPVPAPTTENGALVWQEGQAGPDSLGAWFVRWSFHPVA
jgi:maltooligosyltrehalose trehalohydrolase